MSERDGYVDSDGTYRPMYYDLDGEPMTLMEWAAAFEDHKKKIVRQSLVTNEVWLSTVWLGIDHGFTFTGAPVIFETMIFGGPRDSEQWRYTNELEAQAGHRRVLRELRKEVGLVARLEKWVNGWANL